MGEESVHLSAHFPRLHAGAFLALHLKGCFLANLSMSLKFHGLPLSGGPLALTSSRICTSLGVSLVGEPSPGPCGNEPSAAAAGQVGWALTLAGWDAVSLNSLPDRAVLTQLLNAG